MFFCLLKRCSDLLSQQSFHVSEKEQWPFCTVYCLHSVAMKIIYNFLASVSWRPGSADFEVGTMPSGQMGINVSIGYKCYRHDSRFQMLQNVVLNFYLWMQRICCKSSSGKSWLYSIRNLNLGSTVSFAMLEEGVKLLRGTCLYFWRSSHK